MPVAEDRGRAGPHEMDVPLVRATDVLHVATGDELDALHDHVGRRDRLTAAGCPGGAVVPEVEVPGAVVPPTDVGDVVEGMWTRDPGRAEPGSSVEYVNMG